MDGRMAAGPGESDPVVTLAVCTEWLGPNLAAIVAVLGPHVDHLMILDYRFNPEPTYRAGMQQLHEWGERYGLTVASYPRAALSDCWNTAAAVAQTLAGGAPWTLVVWDPDADPNLELLACLVDGVTVDYDVTVAPAVVAVGFPGGTPAVLCEAEHHGARWCLDDLLERIPEDRIGQCSVDVATGPPEPSAE